MELDMGIPMPHNLGLGSLLEDELVLLARLVVSERQGINLQLTNQACDSQYNQVEENWQFPMFVMSNKPDKMLTYVWI